MAKLHYKSPLLKVFPKWVAGFAFGQHIFFRRGPSAVSPRLLAHEKVHAEQYRKHGVTGFLWIYFVREWRLTYREKSFEKEAYSRTDHLKGL